MRFPYRVLALTLIIAAVPAAATAETPGHDAVVDSLTILLEEQAWSPDVPEVDHEIPDTPGAWQALSLRLDAGMTPGSRWSRAGVSGDTWRAGAVWRRGRDDQRTDAFASMRRSRIGGGAGRLTLRAASGLLEGGAGRSGPASASRSLMPGRPGWRPFTGSPEPGSLTGLALAGRVGILETTIVVGERDRRGRSGGGGESRIVSSHLGSDRLGVSLIRVRDRSGEGWSLGAATAGDAVRFGAEAATWRPTGGCEWRSAWIASVAIREGTLGCEGQLAARDAGYASPGGVRPPVLGADGRRGWAVRGYWRGPGVLCKTLLASSRGRRVVEDSPATSDTRRYEVVLTGGSARRVSWRGRLAGKSEQVRGWTDRHPWLPAAEISSRRETRLSVRVTGTLAETSVRATASGLGRGRSGQDGETGDGWRRLFALRVDRRLGVGVTLRFNQVWAWGEPVDLVSVEVPTDGFMRPRHWGRRDRERSLGLSWRGRGWRLSAAIAAWDVSGEGTETEVVAGLSRGR
jgi:hypothetical protein